MGSFAASVFDYVDVDDHRNSPSGVLLRKTKKKTRSFIDNEYIKGGYMAHFRKYVTLVYVVLTKYSNYKTQSCFPSYTIIMKDTGIKNRNYISKSIKILESYNIIEIRHGTHKRSNLYYLIDPSCWTKISSINTDTTNQEETVSTLDDDQYQDLPW